MSNESDQRPEPSERSTEALLREAFLAGWAEALRATAKPAVFDKRMWMDRRDLLPLDAYREWLSDVGVTPDTDPLL